MDPAVYAPSISAAGRPIELTDGSGRPSDASVEAAKAGRKHEYAIFEIGWRRWMPRAARDLVALMGHWRPDLIVREFAENGATLAGELTGIPVVCAAWTALPADA